MRALLLLQLWLLWSGGLPPQPLPARSPQARLIVYRTREFGGSSYLINLNDQKLGKLPTNRYLQVDVAPGRLKLESARDYLAENQILWLDARAGHTYYVKAVEEVDFMSQMLLLAPVGAGLAQRELPGLRPAAILLPH